MKRKWFWIFAVVPVVLIASQLVYFAFVYNERFVIPSQVDLVLVYSGDEDRAGLARRWFNPKGPLFLFSGIDYSGIPLDRELGLARDRVLVEDRAKTTDQNARYCAPLIRRLGVHSVLLALPWYHLPRALFLTRFYLSGSGITVTPFATSQPRQTWWTSGHFYVECIKFWGSLLRIALARAGVDNWPPHFGG